jgi:hypothetical protein
VLHLLSSVFFDSHSVEIFKYRTLLKSVTLSSIRSVFNILSDSEESLMRYETYSVMNRTFLGIGLFCRPIGCLLSYGRRDLKFPPSADEFKGSSCTLTNR